MRHGRLIPTTRAALSVVVGVLVATGVLVGLLAMHSLNMHAGHGAESASSSSQAVSAAVETTAHDTHGEHGAHTPATLEDCESCVAPSAPADTATVACVLALLFFAGIVIAAPGASVANLAGNLIRVLPALSAVPPIRPDLHRLCISRT